MDRFSRPADRPRGPAGERTGVIRWAALLGPTQAACQVALLSSRVDYQVRFVGVWVDVGANCTRLTCWDLGAPNLPYTLFAFHQSAVIFQAGRVSRFPRAGEGWKAAGKCWALPAGTGHNVVALALD